MPKHPPPDARFWLPLLSLWAASLVVGLHGVGLWAALLFVAGIGYVLVWHY